MEVDMCSCLSTYVAKHEPSTTHFELITTHEALTSCSWGSHFLSFTFTLGYLLRKACSLQSTILCFEVEVESPLLVSTTESPHFKLRLRLRPLGVR